MKSLITFSLLALFTTAATAHPLNEKQVSYTLNDTTFEGTVVWYGESLEPKPGILMVPNWMGPTDSSLEKAKKVAAEGFVVMMVDMYGVEVRPTNGGEAGAAAGTLRNDRPLMRARAAKALAEYKALKDVPLDTTRIAAIGFCFGGGTVLELARSGADLDAVISFHGDLLSPTLESDSGNIQAKVLVLHGAADPYVPQDHVSQFIAALQDTEVDWQLVQFANTVHSFTNPDANSPGQSDYNPVSSSRAFEYMEELLEELWETDSD